jgi:RimJ/RimL family protein N-acetyltransferase
MRQPERAPILKDFPDEFETERLVIRSPRPGDGEEKRRAVCESLPNLRPWLHWAQHEPTAEQAEEEARRERVAFLERADLRMLLFHRESGELVGGSGLQSIEWRIPKFEIGYWCRSRFEGRGYVTEAVRGIAGFAAGHLDARRLEILCDTRNLRSIRVAESAGFEPEATLRDAVSAPDGSVGDLLVYSRFPRAPERG